MARLITSGFESGAIGTSATTTQEPDGLISVGTVSIQSTTVNSGSYAAQMAAANSYAQYSFAGGSTTTPYFARCAMRFTANPSNATTFMSFRTSGGSLLTAFRLNTDGSWSALGPSGSAVLNGSTLTTNKWYRWELKMTANNGSGFMTYAWAFQSLSYDASTIPSSDAIIASATSAPGMVRWGIDEATYSGTWTMQIDDIAVNDSTGSNQNSWCDRGRVLHLPPTSDNTVGNWLKPGGATTNLYTSIDNTPPVGIAHSTSSTNAEKQIYNATNATSSYIANCQTYNAGGLTSGNIMLARALARMGISSLTGTNLATVRLASNPADSGGVQFDVETPAVTAGTDPTGWKTYTGNLVYSPSVTRGTSPTVSVSKDSGSTRAYVLDYLALQVEYQVDTTPPVTTIASTSRTKISRTTGFDSTDVTWSSNEDFTDYQIRVVPSSGSSVGAGTQIEMNQSPASGGTAGTSYTSTITDAELEAASPSEGTKIVKVFVKDLAGNWTTA